jgi:Arc/MetJ family transcription regulator
MCGLLCSLSHMPTNLAIDPDLLERALAVSGEKTKKAAVTKALREFIARREQKKLRELFGSLDWDPGYDYKAERSRR